jgi:hypothetical protein
LIEQTFHSRLCSFQLSTLSITYDISLSGCVPFSLALLIELWPSEPLRVRFGFGAILQLRKWTFKHRQSHRRRHIQPLDVVEAISSVSACP